MVFPYFLQFKTEFRNKEFMIWATVSSWSCFCWLYRASPYKKYNQSALGVDHLVMSMWRVFSCVVGRGCLLWPACSLNKTLLAFALLHFVLQRQTCLLFFYLLTSYFCILIPYDENLGYYDAEWFALKMNWDHFVIFETSTKYCISGSFVDYEGNSILLRDSWSQ